MVHVKQVNSFIAPKLFFMDMRSLFTGQLNFIYSLASYGKVSIVSE